MKEERKFYKAKSLENKRDLSREMVSDCSNFVAISPR